ncbi:MAG: translation initiation factor IF-2 [Candidatus Riflebacteria bacterium]|nr:translation initiation factor IF-2 [Candidatus Riflebacteria bacterium]
MARLFEVSKQLKIGRSELVGRLEKLGFPIKDHPFSVVSEAMMSALEKSCGTTLIKTAETTSVEVPVIPPMAASINKASAPQSFSSIEKPVSKPASNAQSPQVAPPIQAKNREGAKPVASNQKVVPVIQSLPESVKSVPSDEQQLKTSMPKTPYVQAPQPQQAKKPLIPTPVNIALPKEEKKKTGPKPPRIDEEEALLEEVDQRITIIKTTPLKKEDVVKEKKKKKKIKKIPGAAIPKKLLEEQRAVEEILEIPDPMLQAQSLESLQPTLEEVPRITVPAEVTTSELGKYLNIPPVDIVKKLFSLGVFASLNQRLEKEQVELIGREYGREILFSDDVIEFEEDTDDEKDLQIRPPVVTIMGHVDHGKTSLLDKIRHSKVAEGEVGGITQHIGAYQVKTEQGVITFLDTPGHEAFTAMRAQGTQATDIAILVVACDDGVQAQTVEAIHHAQAAGCPIIVAMNKVDKPDANVEKVKQQLMPYNLISEDWGGKTIMVQVSAKTGQGINDLLEMILLQAEMMELKANPDKSGRGIIIEARLDKGMGPIATVLVQNGRVENGDSIICGTSFGRVKALIDDSGNRVKMAGPSYPVAILGLSEVPRVGDRLMVVENTKFARYVSVLRMKKEREERLGRENRLKLMDLFKHVTEGKVKELNIIIKADVQGSSGALKDALERLSTAEIKVNAIHAGVGAITESDVMLAAASNAIIIGFHVRPAPGVDDIAERENVEIKVFRIIFDAIDAIKLALKGMYEPEYKEEILGRVEIRKVFKISGSGTIAGSFVVDGKVQRDANVRIVRDGVEVFEGKICSLKRFKDDVREVMAGYECGIGVANYNDLKEKDMLELFCLKEIERK